MRLYPTISPYVGAKALLAAELAQLFYYRNVKEYYSLFTGMANDIIQAPLHGMKIHANDLDKGVYCLLKVLCDTEKCKVLYHSMFDLRYTEETFLEAKRKIADREQLMQIPDEIERARYMWTALLMSMNGQMKQFKGIKSGLEQEGFTTMLINKWNLSDFLSNVTVTNDNAIDIVKRLKETGRTDIFCYADPPYYGENCSVKDHYKVDLNTYEGQKLLLDTIKDVPFKMMISNYDNTLYNEVLVDKCKWKKHKLAEVCRTMRIGGEGQLRSRVSEMIWTNYNVEELTNTYK